MHLKSLVQKITQTFGWHHERCHTFASMIHGLIDQKNVQHQAFVDALQSKGHFKSKLERIRRFFAGQDTGARDVSKNPRYASDFGPHTLEIRQERHQLFGAGGTYWICHFSFILVTFRASRMLSL
jgi:hypothetical protein